MNNIMRHREFIKIADILIEHGTEVNDALLVATFFKQPELVNKLLALGADPNFEQGIPLIRAVWGGNLPTIDILLKAGANINIENLAGKTPLGMAAKQGKKEVAEFLLNNGARLSTQDIDIAINNKHFQLAEFLAKKDLHENC